MTPRLQRLTLFPMMLSVQLRERSYPIYIESGALSRCPNSLSDALHDALPDAALPGEIALFCQASVGRLLGDDLAKNLEAAGQKVLRFEVGEGESFKSLSEASRAYDALAEAKFSRRGALWALGGGVTGDLAGFVAATWMRGISLVQVPTTLLAMVDSSVGGKTGVNHSRAKNLIGAFWQPVAVLCDPSSLKTLPRRELSAGLAEVIKYGVIADANFFGFLEANLDAALDLDEAVLARIIARSCEIKAEVVGEDERESDAIGRRAILNYGHTVGHALEAVTRYGELLHGEAIAIGMTVAARLAIELGTIENAAGTRLLQRQSALFERAGLPISVPNGLEWDTLWAAMALDKKTRGSSINFILPTRLGEVKRVDDVAEGQVKAAVLATVSKGNGVAVTA